MLLYRDQNQKSYGNDVYDSINHTELTDLAGHMTHFGLQAIKQYYIPDTSLAAEEVGGIISIFSSRSSRNFKFISFNNFLFSLIYFVLT